MIAENFKDISMDILIKLKPERFIEMVSSTSLQCDSAFLSEQVASYLQSSHIEVTSSLVHSLTKSSKMPHISPRAAVFYTKVIEEHLADDCNDSTRKSLLLRCAKAFIDSEVYPQLPVLNAVSLGSNGKGMHKKKLSEYESLSKDTRIKLLEETLSIERQEKRDLLRYQMFKVTVRGIGIRSINGIYRINGICDDVGFYVKDGKWQGKKRTFTIYRVGKGTWFISAFPKDTNPNTDAVSDIEYLFHAKASGVDGETPPEKWQDISDDDNTSYDDADIDMDVY